MSTHEIVGNYSLVTRDRTEADRAMRVEDKIGEVVARQVALRGSDKPFRFKAFGHTWQYTPEPTVIALKVEDVARAI